MSIACVHAVVSTTMIYILAYLTKDNPEKEDHYTIFQTIRLYRSLISSSHMD
jgi:hypothetical protein